MITNIYIRLFWGSWVIILGIVLGKMYLDRDKDNWLGRFYRNSYKKNKGNDLVNPKYMYIILSLLCIFMGIIAIIFGIRKTLVGVL